MTESDLQEAIVEAARWHGWLVYHTFDSRRSEPGFPDLVLVHPKRQHLPVFAEIKSARGRLTPPQISWIGALLHSGVKCFVWRPENLDDAIAFLANPEEPA